MKVVGLTNDRRCSPSLLSLIKFMVLLISFSILRARTEKILRDTYIRRTSDTKRDIARGKNNPQIYNSEIFCESCYSYFYLRHSLFFFVFLFSVTQVKRNILYFI